MRSPGLASRRGVTDHSGLHLAEMRLPDRAATRATIQWLDEHGETMMKRWNDFVAAES
jgi:hypothetical protein